MGTRRHIDPTDLITKATLARKLKCTIRGLNKLIRRGDLPRPFPIGRRPFWLKRTLARFFRLREKERGT